MISICVASGELDMVDADSGRQSDFDDEQGKAPYLFSVSRSPVLFIVAVTVSPLLLAAVLRSIGY